MAPLNAAETQEGLTVKCRLANRAVADFSVIDISAAGCMVEKRAWTLKANDRVLVKLPGLEFQPATVVWTDEENAGIAFETLLYEPVLLRFRGKLQNRPEAA